MKLIRVNRKGEGTDVHMEDIAGELRNGVRLINSDHVQPEDDIPVTGEFFIVHHERDVEIVVRHLAESNPGREVQVYSLESVSECPPAEMITKRVTADGILPV